MKIVALAGGVGGAKLADGLAQVVPPEDLTVVVNTGDDFEHLGLTICPDLDTVCYTLAGMANSETGWGLKGETWAALDSLKRLGGPVWFQLGDKDLGTHLERTRRLKQGDSLSTITRDFCRAWGIGATVLPMSDNPVRTHVFTVNQGELPFQNYFVERQCQPIVQDFRFDGAENAIPAPGVLEALDNSDVVVICPSNPWVSIGPILAVPGILECLQRRPVVAVSPIIGGQAVKGPAAKMYQELGISPSALAVAHQYSKFLQGFVMDCTDANQTEEIEQWGIIVGVMDIMMPDVAERKRLAQEISVFCEHILRR